MRRLAILVPGLGLALAFLAAALLPGCASSSASLDDAGVDAASGPQPLGQPCDPAIATPCVPTADPCLGVTCDPVSLKCAQFVTDAGPPCRSGSAPCTTSADCDLGLTCGFSVTAGCGAQGTCLDPVLLCEDDASACATSFPPLCGCNGAPAAIVVAGFAASPVSSSTAGVCPDGGGGMADGAAGDGSLDAATDGGT
jgi:hypothetical protein